MNKGIETLDGWYCLHEFRTIDWRKWKSLSAEKRQQGLDEFLQILEPWKVTTLQKEGSHGIYQILGHKADLMLMILRPTMDDLLEIENAFHKTAIAECTIPTGSYVSVVELSNYLSQDENPYENPEIRSRLYPTLPERPYVCFYSMNKRRLGDDNWYRLSMEERSQLMRSHSLVGRKYAGKVKQIILGSVGLDDDEWGVALFADDLIQIKKLVYEMRFDEVSARYGEFGSFYVGSTLHQERLVQLFHIED